MYLFFAIAGLTGGCKARAHPKATQLATGASFACALLQDGTVECWGADDHGQLGRGALSPAEAGTDGGDAGPAPDAGVGDAGADAGAPVGLPGAVSGLTHVQSIAAGAGFACAVLANATVACWGQNNSGQLGQGQPGPDSPVPIAVPKVTGAVALGLGQDHACAALSDGSFTCWGKDDLGQLGDLLASPPDNVSSLALGSLHTCALLSSTGVRCWGDDTAHQLGGSNGQPVAALGGATKLAAAGDYTCALLASGAVTCWGNVDPKCTVGCGSGPAEVANLGSVQAIALGLFHPCALTADGSIECWDYAGSVSPVSGVHEAESFAVGPDFGCAIRPDGSVECWGDNALGELGDGTRKKAAEPVLVKL